MGARGYHASFGARKCPARQCGSTGTRHLRDKSGAEYIPRKTGSHDPLVAASRRMAGRGGHPAMGPDDQDQNEKGANQRKAQ